MGDKDLYPALLGIDWAFENYAIIDLKKELMIFEDGEVRVTQPLDPYQGLRYTEIVDNREDAQLFENLYQMTAGKREDYINLTTTDSVSWRSVQSSELGLEIAWEDWQQGGYKTSTRRCASIARIHWFGAEIRECPTLSNMQEVNSFIAKVEDKLSEEQRIPLMDVALQSTSARWWKNHYNSLSQWSCVAAALRARFKEDEGPRSKRRYQGNSDLKDHLKLC